MIILFIHLLYYGDNKLASALLRLPSVVPKHSSRQYSLSRRVYPMTLGLGHKVDEGSYQPSRCFALPVIQKGHIFIKRVNDCPIMNVDMLEQWSKEFEQSNASPNVIGCIL
jgi:hypothetical protein